MYMCRECVYMWLWTLDMDGDDDWMLKNYFNKFCVRTFVMLFPKKIV